MHAARIRRAADLAHVSGYPLVIHDRDVPAARHDAITAAREGLRVIVNTDVSEPAVVVHAGRFPLDAVAGDMPADPAIARAKESLFRREFTPEALALLDRAKERLAYMGFNGRDWETAKLVARACAALGHGSARVETQHVAEALSYRRVVHHPRQVEYMNPPCEQHSVAGVTREV